MDSYRLTSTYRVQLNKSFTLNQAREIVEYLHALGISHLYCSPILKARPGSTHGYDVVDPRQVNPEIGTLDDLRALATDLHARGMGMIVDIVPNHMGIGPDNAYWEDVLAHGVNSRYAKWFDIDWKAGDGKVVLPVLQEELDALVERDAFGIDVTGKAPRLTFQGSSWPLDPATLPNELQLAHFDPTAVTDATVFVRGDAGRRERLRKLLDAQHYRLAYWRRGPVEIDYRRFFDVNDLAALRQEDPEVFAETHELILSLVREGVIDGLRVDHIDGLKDPAEYLERLRTAVFGLRTADPRPRDVSETPLRTESAVRSADSAVKSFPIFVEKILSPGESLRTAWPVQGTTGYEFLNDLEDVFLDPAGFDAVEKAYRRARRLTSGDFGDIAYDGKVKVLRGALRADVLHLVRLLADVLAAGKGSAVPDGELEAGIVQFIASLPVYRTYVDGRESTPHPDDVAVVERAMTATRARLGDAPATKVVRLLADIVLGRDNPDHPLPPPAARRELVQRLQQTSGPATAKGIEDTALYVYVPLASRNEVGGAPDRCLEDAVGRFHRANAARACTWPLALTCTNTHDTKRSADVRARLDVISECAPLWQRTVARWRRLNQRHRSLVKGRLAPDTNTEYLFYQTLVGIWPSPRPGRRADDIPERDWLASARERLEQYMLKAVKEAKTRTSWTDPDQGYEDALERFIAAVLEPADDAPFLSDVARFVAHIAGAGEWNSLSRVLLHLTAPGTPDTYRGDELWFFALVDPDNRRAVDYDERRRILETTDYGPRTADQRAPDASRPWSEVRSPQSAVSPLSAKLSILRQALHTRRAHPQLFSHGAYVPLAVRGVRAQHVVAFARVYDGQAAVVVAPRLTLSIPGLETGKPDWSDTEVALPAELAGKRFQPVIAAGYLALPDAASTLKLGEVLKTIPLCLLLTT